MQKVPSSHRKRHGAADDAARTVTWAPHVLRQGKGSRLYRFNVSSWPDLVIQGRTLPISGRIQGNPVRQETTIFASLISLFAWLLGRFERCSAEMSHFLGPWSGHLP